MLCNITAGPYAVAFKISGNNAVIPDQRECLYNSLPKIALICQRLQIACHACGKHDFRHDLAFGAKAAAPEHFPVFQHQICRFPHISLPFRISPRCSGACLKNLWNEPHLRLSKQAPAASPTKGARAAGMYKNRERAPRQKAGCFFVNCVACVYTYPFSILSYRKTAASARGIYDSILLPKILLFPWGFFLYPWGRAAAWEGPPRGASVWRCRSAQKGGGAPGASGVAG